MTRELSVFTDQEQLTAVTSLRVSGEGSRAMLCELGGGILRFSDMIFPGAGQDAIMAQKFEREAEGKGAHFDVYGTLLSADYPWLAVYNLGGTATIRTVTLPEDLAAIYDKTYPEPTDTAYEARRHFAGIAFTVPDAAVSTGVLRPRTGLVLPQRVDGPHIVHEVTPFRADVAGEFVKMMVPSSDDEAKATLAGLGYVSLDELVTRGLDSVAGTVSEISGGEISPAGFVVETDEEEEPLLLLSRIRRSTGWSRGGLSTQRFD